MAAPPDGTYGPVRRALGGLGRLPLPRGRAHIKLLKAALALAVVGAVGWNVARAVHDLGQRGGYPRLDAAWLALALLAYMAALACSAVFFWLILRSGPAAAGFVASVRAHAVGHIAKYVPGKAMVIVVRAHFLARHGVHPATAASAAVYETLVLMAAGGLVATLGLAYDGGPGAAVLASSVFALAWLCASSPFIFARLSSLIRSPFPGVGPGMMPRFSCRLWWQGLLLSACGWVLMGLSQACVIRSLGAAFPPPGQWPLIIGCVALATVAGFAAAVLPGGLGVREWFLLTTLAAAIGQDLAVISALCLRLTWIAGEALAALTGALCHPEARDEAIPSNL